eukprot:PhM_4_TR16025/c0_g1_i1/m.50346/K11498/CENPE; centromeric protein E
MDSASTTTVTPCIDGSADCKENVIAAVRFRLTSDAEADAWHVSSDRTTVSGTSGSPSTFDAVFTPTSTNKDVYDTSVKSVVDSFVDGINGCVFAYGQTFSGKTHTIFGVPADAGLLPRALDDIMDRVARQRRGTRAVVSIAMFEVYCERVTDLLAPELDPSQLTIRDLAGSFYVDNLTSRLVTSKEAAHDLVRYAMENRTIGQSYLNDRSSRAHTVCKLVMAAERNQKGGVRETTVSEFNFVDLAGSESLTYQFDAAQREETKAINLSLFSLRNVITSLAAKEGHVPFRNSVLTKVLHSALGGNCRTSIVCTCHPGAEHVPFTKQTLHFGDVSRSIQLRIHVNKLLRKAKEGVVVKPADEQIVKLTEAEMKAKKVKVEDVSAREDRPVVARRLPTRQGDIACHTIGEPGDDTPLVLCLHGFGNGCCGADWGHLFNAISAAGYSMVAPDMPGFGETPGARHTSRSERMLHTGGPIEILEDLIDVFTKSKTSKFAVVGWDWGGNMAFHLALLRKTAPRVSALALFHPNWTDSYDHLSRVKAPLLLCWVPVDQFHAYTNGKKMAGIVKNSKLLSFKCPARNAELSTSPGRLFLSQISEAIMSHLKAHHQLVTKPIPAPCTQQEDTAGGDDDDSDTDVSDVDLEFEDPEDEDLFSRSSSFLAQIVCDAVVRLENRHPRRDLEKKKSVVPATTTLSLASKPTGTGPVWGVQRMREALESGEIADLRQCYLPGGGGCNRPLAASVFGSLPILLGARPEDFVAVGLWPSLPRGHDILDRLVKYPPGRRVWLRAPVNGSMLSPETFLTYDASESAAPMLCHGVVKDASKPNSAVVVDVPHSHDRGVTSVSVPWSALLAWNEPTNFRVSKTFAHFEDTITLRAHDFLTRAKLVECAIAIAPIVCRMDFASALASREGAEALVDLQLQAIARVRDCMNMIHHVQKGKDPTRMCVPDVGKLATYGQWHCHGMASVEAALLLPFAKVLGLEIRFIDGFYAMTSGRDQPGSWDGRPRGTCDHTWLEVTLLPSFTRLVADASMDEQEGYYVPLEHACSLSGHRFPVRNLTSAGPVPTVEAVMRGRDVVVCEVPPSTISPKCSKYGKPKVL